MRHWTFGNIPFSITPFLMRELASFFFNDDISFPSPPEIPGTFVRTINFSALSAEAIFEAAWSALILYVTPLLSHPIGAITGMYPLS